jgi:hypothetical protein
MEGISQRGDTLFSCLVGIFFLMINNCYEMSICRLDNLIVNMKNNAFIVVFFFCMRLYIYSLLLAIYTRRKPVYIVLVYN